MNSIFTRRSVRKYKNDKIEKEKIEKLLRAAMQAPSAVNQQPWEFIVVENKENLAKLSQMSPHSKMISEAPLAFILLGNKEAMKYPQYWEQDMGAATQNMMLQSVELGLGSVWLGVAPLEERIEYIKDMFNLNDNVIPYSIVVVGYPANENANEFIDRFNESKVHYEKY